MSKRKELGDPVHTRFFPETEEKLRRVAKENGRTVSGMIRWLVMCHLHELDKEK